MNSLKIISFFLMFSACQTRSAAQQTYQLDTRNSKILWNSGKLGNHTGYLLFNSGTLYYSAAGEPVNGSFLINTAGIRNTDRISEADQKKNEATLKDEDFLDAARYPTATIHVTKITRINKSDSFAVTGDLTIKNITHPVSFIASLIQKNKNIHITGSLDMHRYLWNIHRPANQSTAFLSGLVSKTVGDEAGITLDITLTQ